MSEHAIQVRLQQRQDYQFDIDFGGQVPRLLGQFEAFCTESQSVAQGIPLRVEVFDALGVRLK